MPRAGIVTEFPRNVRDVENLWIPMPDGCRLAARMWVPDDAERSPVPVIIEYIPYRKRDRTRGRDEPMHRFFAGHGFAAIRIDLRGSGDSDGVLSDEYSTQEHEDALHAIRWASAQSWCDGNAGMIGKSWGGFNALQVAAIGPPALKAVISVCSTDDRYADDAHYMGGCLLNENLLWGSTLFTLSSLPPDPGLVGDRWRAMWHERLEANPGYVETWLRHQRRDDYWKHGSICEAYSSIRCPVFLVGGWADAYTNSIPRMLEKLTCPLKGLIGPWAHVYPHNGVPGPAIGFLQEAVRWWDQWLKGIETGIMEEPLLRAWMQESVPPRSHYDTRPGRWISVNRWPPGGARPILFHLSGKGLLRDASDALEETIPLATPQWVGGAGGDWCASGEEGEMPVDQSDDDAGSLTFESEPLKERLEVLGAPRAILEISSDRPDAFLCVRLNDVLPDGSSTRVTYGVLNLTHRDGHESPRPLEPGRRYRIQMALNNIAHSFPVGHKLRLSISTTYWPLLWPSPETAVVSIDPTTGRLELPAWQESDPAPTVRFEPPLIASSEGVVDIHGFQTTRSLHRSGDETILRIESDLTEDGAPALRFIPALKLEYGNSFIEEYRIRDGDPLSASAEIHQTACHTRGGSWIARVRTSIHMRSSKENFELGTRLEAFEGDRCIFDRRRRSLIPRDHV